MKNLKVDCKTLHARAAGLVIDLSINYKFTIKKMINNKIAKTAKKTFQNTYIKYSNSQNTHKYITNNQITNQKLSTNTLQIHN